MGYKDPETIKAYHREWYENRGGKEIQFRNGAEYNARKRKWYIEQKERPCTDCKQSFPHYVMDFDHVRGEKKFTISSRVNAVGYETLKKEIAKCDLVCANCHRIRTHKRKAMGRAGSSIVSDKDGVLGSTPKHRTNRPFKPKKPAKVVKLICNFCKREYDILERIVRGRKKEGRKLNFCSRNCSGKVTGKMKKQVER